MNTRERISNHTYLGGSWYHLNIELQDAGMSKNLSELYISHVRKNLGIENTKKALIVFDDWLVHKKERKTKLLLKIVSW